MPQAFVHVKRVAACEHGGGGCFVFAALLHAPIQVSDSMQLVLEKLRSHAPIPCGCIARKRHVGFVDLNAVHVTTHANLGYLRQGLKRAGSMVWKSKGFRVLGSGHCMGCTHELSREGAEVACAASDTQDAHARAHTKVLQHLRVDMRSAAKQSRVTRCSSAAGTRAG